MKLIRYLGSAALILAWTSIAPADQPNPLEKAPSKWVKSDDIKVHYKSLGDGDTALVFVHGWTCNHTFWRAQAAAFDGKARMLFIDLPGHGKSDKPKIDYTMDLFARGVNAVMEDAGVQSAVLIGHSMGTPVIRQFYRLYPKKTRALVAVDGSFRAYFKNPKEAEPFLAMFEKGNFKEMAEQFADRMFVPETPAEVRAEVKETFQGALPHVAVSAMKGMLDLAIWKDDPIKVPLQAIMAPNPMWSGDYKEYVQKLNQHVDYRVMQGVGHFLMMEKPKEFNEILSEFLKKHSALKS